MPAAPPAVFSASLAPASLGAVFAPPSSAPAAPLGFYVAPTRTPGDVGTVLVTPAAPAGPLGFYTVPTLAPANVGSVLASPAAPAAPIAPASSVTATPANVGSVLGTPAAPSAPIAPPARPSPTPAAPGAVFARPTTGDGVCQVETILCAGDLTQFGDCEIVVTAAAIPGGSRRLGIRLSYLESYNWSGQIRGALAGDDVIRQYFTVGGESILVTLTRRSDAITGLACANDDSLNISVNNVSCVGPAFSHISSNTVPGVAGLIPATPATP